MDDDALTLNYEFSQLYDAGQTAFARLFKHVRMGCISIYELDRDLSIDEFSYAYAFPDFVDTCERILGIQTGKDSIESHRRIGGRLGDDKRWTPRHAGQSLYLVCGGDNEVREVFQSTFREATKRIRELLLKDRKQSATITQLVVEKDQKQQEILQLKQDMEKLLANPNKRRQNGLDSAECAKQLQHQTPEQVEHLVAQHIASLTPEQLESLAARKRSEMAVEGLGSNQAGTDETRGQTLAGSKSEKSTVETSEKRGDTCTIVSKSTDVAHKEEGTKRQRTSGSIENGGAQKEKPQTVVRRKQK